MVYKFLLIFLSSGLLISGWSECLAQSPGSLIKKGNQAYAEQRYEDALEAYEEAAVSEPESPQIYFNKGTARYQQGEYLQAIELFEQAAEKSKDLSLERVSRYNIGNSYFRESERQRDSDLQKSLEALEKSIGAYQQTLELDAEFTNAAHNIEVARLSMKQVLDELKKQQEQATEKQKQQQKAADKLKELIDRQSDLAEETKELAKKQQKQEISEKAAEDAAEKQDALKSETQRLQDQMADQQQNDTAAENIQKHLEKAISEQESAQEKVSQKKMDDAGKTQDQAAEELKKALESMQQQGEQGQKHQEGQQQQQEMGEQGQQQQQGGEPESSKQEPEEKTVVQVGEDAHDIINEEKESHEERQLAIPGNYRSVDKDW